MQRISTTVYLADIQFWKSSFSSFFKGGARLHYGVLGLEVLGHPVDGVQGHAMRVAHGALLHELGIERPHGDDVDAVAASLGLSHVVSVVDLENVGVVDDDRVELVHGLDGTIVIPSVSFVQLEGVEHVVPLGGHEVVVGRENGTVSTLAQRLSQDVASHRRFARTGDTAHDVQVHNTSNKQVFVTCLR